MISRAMASFSTGIFVQTTSVPLNEPTEGGEDELMDALTMALFAKVLENEDEAVA